MTPELKQAIQTLTQELESNEILADNWRFSFTNNILLKLSHDNIDLKPDALISLVEAVGFAFFDLVAQSNEPDSWVYNDKQKILDKEKAFKKLLEQERLAKGER